jgi:hypothetical protein
MKMYDLNYTGGTQVWAMMRDSHKSGDTVFENQEYENRIKALQADPKFKSDSEKLQSMLNMLNTSLANIGKYKFDETEWAILEKQAEDVAAIYRKLDEKDQTRQITDAITVPSEQITLPTSAGGGPAGTLQLFQGGQNFASYLATGLTDFDRRYADMMSYKDKGGRAGEIVNRFDTATSGIDFSRLSPDQNKFLGVDFDNLVVEFGRMKSFGISEREYNQLTPILDRLSNVLDQIRQQQAQTTEINVSLP